MNNQIKTYNGNPLLKRINQSIEWTPQLLKEYVKCEKDPVYFIEKYMKIISDKGLVNFKLYDYQKKMIKSFANNRFNIVTTARQAGKSTTTCGFILWFIIFHSEKTVALLANKGDTAREILDKVRFGYQHLPMWLQQGVGKWNEGSVELENNSRVLAAATSSDGIRGYAVDVLFIDEAAHIDNWDAFFTSVFPTISSRENSRVILVSTPNGLNHFYKTWALALEGQNEYKPIQVNWNDVPGRDEKWKQTTLAGMNFDIEKFEQEYSCEFLGSSGTLISGSKLKQLVPKTPLAQKEGLTQFSLPEKDHIYMMVCDVSRGKGLDYSAFQLLDVTKMPYQQVCVYRNNSITPYDYAEIIHRVGKLYNNAAVLVEINDIGEQVSHTLHYDLDYENVLFTENAGRSGKRITGGFAGKNIDKGIRTTKVVKSVGCSLLKLLIEQDQLIVNDFNTIREFSTFSKKGTSYEAEPGNHDDLVMCLVLFSWLSEQQYFKDITNINTLHELKEKTEEDLEQDMSPFGFIEDGREVYDEVIEQYIPESWMWNVPENF
jgi:Terminase large subunit, T4likevirus-type, N-terminal/Terminase RNaseH-like domain